jgi:phosphoserine phosphatase RsbU/P
MKVLIAEDDGASRTILSAQLTKMGYEVLESDDGVRAWELYEREHPGLVITDWMMPEMSGPDLCRRIRSVQRPEYTYLIILTALGDKSAYIEGMSSGADDFIVKPADTAELTVRLRVAERILSLQSQMRQLERLLPICPKCKRIHANDERWEPVESYITKRSEAHFSHGICPECYTNIVQPQLAAIRLRNQTQRQ